MNVLDGKFFSHLDIQGKRSKRPTSRNVAEDGGLSGARRVVYPVLGGYHRGGAREPGGLRLHSDWRSAVLVFVLTL